MNPALQIDVGLNVYWSMGALRGRAQNQNGACFVQYIKIINTFLKNKK